MVPAVEGEGGAKPGRDWQALFDALASDHEQLAQTISSAMRSQIPAYESIALDDLSSSVLIEIDRVLESARYGRADTGDGELSELAAVGEARAQQGVPVDDMLRAWRIGVQAVVSRARALGAQLAIEDRSLLDFVEATLAWSDVGMVVTARAHRSADIALARQDQERRAAFVRGLLFGTLAPAEIGLQASAYGVDPTREYVAVRARTDADRSPRTIEHSLGFQGSAPPHRGLHTLVDGDIGGFLLSRPTGSLAGVVGVGPPRPLERLTESFRLATRALLTAEGFKLTGVHDVASLGLRTAVAADGDVGDTLTERYLDPLQPDGSRLELIASLKAYFECGMHTERAATRLFVHPNTLRYRIGRFESLAGASLRDPTTAFEVWWALERDALRSNGDPTDPGLEQAPKPGR